MQWLIKSVVLTLFGVLFIISIAWGALALWFQFPGPDFLRIFIVAGFVAIGAATPIAWRRRSGFRIVYPAIFCVVLAFYLSLEPPSAKNWSPEVARQVTGVIEADTLFLSDARDFKWRTAEDVDKNWKAETYDLSTVSSVDLLMSYWGGPHMAHLMLSFGFEDGRYLTWSVEVRRPVGTTFSPVADFFRVNSLVLVAGEEKDIVGLRSNIQNARVHMFSLALSPKQGRGLLESLVQKANELDEKPEFFNSVFSNCSLTVIRIAQSAGAGFPIDWRVIVNGFFPDFLFDNGRLVSGMSLEELYAKGDISTRAREVGLTRDFSQAIRVGVPTANSKTETE